MKTYLLEGRTPVPVPVEVWVRSESKKVLVAEDKKMFRDYTIKVVTEFTGVGDLTDEDGQPLVFETIVVGNSRRAGLPCKLFRTPSWEEAVAKHESVCVDENVK